MSKPLVSCLFLFLLISSAVIAVPSTDSQALLRQASRLEREITETLASANVEGPKQANDKQYDNLVVRYRMKIRQLQSNAFKLSDNQRDGLLTLLSKAHRQIDFFTQARKNARLMKQADARRKAIPSSKRNSSTFKPEADGSISGTIIDTVTSQPIQWVIVHVYDSTGQFVESTSTNTQGQYVTDPIPPGTYFVIAWPYELDEHIAELYDNIICPVGSCDPLQGAPVQVLSGMTTTGIDFSLEVGGSISGSIHDEVSGLPLNMFLRFYDSQGNFLLGVPTYTAGSYELLGLTSGTYFVATSSSSAYVNEIYDNVPCQGICFPYPGGGTPVTVVQGSDTGNIDFLLQKAGQISGVVTDASSGQAINAMVMNLYKSDGSWIASTYTQSDGSFTFGGLRPGQYFARTTSDPGIYLDELFDNIPCEGYLCNIAGGTPISVVSDQTTNIQFSLSRGASVKGRIIDSDTGQPIAGVDLSIYDFYEDLISEAVSDSRGNYDAGGLSSGTYFVMASKTSYVTEAYDDKPCQAEWVCHGIATPIIISGDTNVSGIDFALTRGATVAGSVKDSQDQTPIDAEVYVYNEMGDIAGYGFTDSSGNYSVTGLPGGTYYASTAFSDWVDEIYDNIPWLGDGYTDALGGTPIIVAPSQTTQVDFALDRGATISGSVTDSTTGLPVQGTIFVVSPNYELSGYGDSDSQGNYSLSGLLDGTYHAVFFNGGDHLSEVYDNNPCGSYYCDINDGTPIPVAAPQEVTGINFSPTQGGFIKGFITDAATSLPLGNATVDIYDSQGQHVNYGYTYADSQGVYYSFSMLPPGDFYAVASSFSYMTELYDNLPCLWSQCNVLTGVPIHVNPGQTTTGINFALGQGNGKISGTVTDSVSGQPLSDAFVSVFNQISGNSVAFGITDALGHYTTSVMPGGNYFVRAGVTGHIGELYAGIQCPFLNCDPATGTPVVVQDGNTTPGIDLSLDPAGAIQGIVTNEQNGAPLQDMMVDIFDSSGQLVHTIYTDATGSYVADDLPDGTYYARVYGMGSYAIELYDNIVCINPSCDPLMGTPITVSSSQGAAEADFALGQVGRIQGLVRDAASGARIANLTVKILHQDGAVITTTQTDQHGRYFVYNLPPADYFLIAEGGTSYVDQLYNGIPCPNSACNPDDGTRISLNGSTAQPINFYMSDTAFLYSEEFESGQIPTDWTFTGPAWTESQGSLIGNALLKKASAYAAPAYAGCSQCTFQFGAQATGSTSGKIWMFGWHNGKSQIELLMKDQKNVWILKERVNGAIVQKVKALKPIAQNTDYHIRMTYDGTHILVYVDDSTPLFTITPQSIPSGTAGMMAKGVTALFGYLHIY